MISYRFAAGVIAAFSAAGFLGLWFGDFPQGGPEAGMFHVFSLAVLFAGAVGYGCLALFGSSEQPVELQFPTIDPSLIPEKEHP
ncbi:hypothetical protein [Variovorax paradoxus]|uniref:Uncharacterized protein n=1 Tax=Variovorax paradoxus TaxID=34073 RepID=A0A679JC89_VARPD|nr:hypothetical protein VVAX_04351 [Variovorax paradoxus]